VSNVFWILIEDRRTPPSGRSVPSSSLPMGFTREWTTAFTIFLRWSTEGPSVGTALLSLGNSATVDFLRWTLLDEWRLVAQLCATYISFIDKLDKNYVLKISLGSLLSYLCFYFHFVALLLSFWPVMIMAIKLLFNIVLMLRYFLFCIKGKIFD